MELSPDTFTVDTVGEPGARVFFLQASGDFGTVAFVLEKQQAAALAERLREVLLAVDPADAVATATPARDGALTVSEPAEPEFRIGTMGLAYDESIDRVIVFVQRVDEDDDVPPAEDDDDGGVRFTLARDRARAFVLHALAVVAEGRPLCQLCGLPMDPHGHDCPAVNGHRAGEA